MKAIAIFLLLALYGAASANLMARQATCAIDDSNYVAQLQSQCPAAAYTSATAQQLCNHNCAGLLCNYFKTYSYPSSCVSVVAQACRDGGASVPSACGALALATIKGVLVAVLLLAAMFIAI